MKFAPGAYVFPGGSVDEADADPAIAWHGPDPAEVGARLGASPELASAGTQPSEPVSQRCPAGHAFIVQACDAATH